MSVVTSVKIRPASLVEVTGPKGTLHMAQHGPAWNGMVELRDGQARKLILLKEPDSFAAIFNSLFAGIKGEPGEEAVVLMAHPAVATQLGLVPNVKEKP